VIELINENPSITKNRISSAVFTFPRTEIFYFGNYQRKDILHNIMFEVKKSEKVNTNKTYVRGEMSDFHHFIDNPYFNYFFDEIFASIQQVDNSYKKKENIIIEEAWGNILKKGQSVHPHDHPCHQGILYLTDGNPLIFPQVGFRFTPKAGDYLIAPPRLIHYVEEVKEDVERINIVFNYTIYDNFKSVNNLYSKDSGQPGSK